MTERRPWYRLQCRIQKFHNRKRRGFRWMIPSRRTDHIFALDMWSVRFCSPISSTPRRVYFFSDSTASLATQSRPWYTVIGSTNTSFLQSFDKGKHARRRVFPALFALFALTGGSPPASQKAKITRKSIAGRCEAVLPEQKCVQTRKDPQRILAVLSRGLTQYGLISARQNRVCPC